MTLRIRAKIMTVGILLISIVLPATADNAIRERSPTIPVIFGARALLPDEPVNPKIAFASQIVTLPAVVCTICTDQDTWTRTWSAFQATLDRDNSVPENGWYMFRSGLQGIGFSVKAEQNLRQTENGTGSRLTENNELTIGLSRLTRQTAAGLADLPAAEFVRITTFRGVDGREKYRQEDTFQVSADFRVPTCTSTTRSLIMALPDMDRGHLRQVVPGRVSESSGSVPQLVVANCSANTHKLRVRFIPSGRVVDSDAGPATILVGQDEQGHETGTGFLMRYEARGFGTEQKGVARWDSGFPLMITNPSVQKTGDQLTEGITLSLQAFWARPDNGLPLGAGKITAKGLYQVSYE